MQVPNSETPVFMLSPGVMDHSAETSAQTGKARIKTSKGPRASAHAGRRPAHVIRVNRLTAANSGATPRFAYSAMGKNSTAPSPRA
ncbi:MAG: hypothetical protein ACYYKD_00460 [Rhodospirillales bacterium]